jgi:hypothetical protein
MLKDFFGCCWTGFVVGSQGDQSRKYAASGGKLLEIITTIGIKVARGVLTFNRFYSKSPENGGLLCSG